MREIEVTIRNGFPLRVTYRACPREPDVGIFYDYVEVDEVLTSRGRSTDFLKITDAEYAQIEEACAVDMREYDPNEGRY